MNKLETAIAFAVNAHSGQIDKGGKPYILHPLNVMLKMDTEQEMIVAVLHDVIEDCKVTYVQLLDLFGKEIADAVDALSRRGENGPDQKEVYFDYINRVKNAGDLAIKIKLGDLEHNSSPERIKVLPLDKQSVVHRYQKARKILLDKSQ